MNKDQEPTIANDEETPAQAAPEEGTLESPSNKYERIMMAAAEAARLNEEMRRKGTKYEHKVTIEALKRVDEGKVKSVVENQEALARAKAMTESPADTFFMTAPLGGGEDVEEVGGGSAPVQDDAGE